MAKFKKYNVATDMGTYNIIATKLEDLKTYLDEKNLRIKQAFQHKVICELDKIPPNFKHVTIGAIHAVSYNDTRTDTTGLIKPVYKSKRSMPKEHDKNIVKKVKEMLNDY